MSNANNTPSTTEDSKEPPQKSLPLDLARSVIPVAIPPIVRTVIDTSKPTPISVTQPLRGLRVLTTPQGATTSPTIISSSIVPQGTILKSQDVTRTHLATMLTAPQNQVSTSQIMPQQMKATQITLTTTQNVGATYHVPRGPAVVANLAAPRSNISSGRAPIVVTGQAITSIRPPRTPSPTTWTSNNQIKTAGGTTPLRGSTVVKATPQIINRSPAQSLPPSVSAIRPGAILHSAITVGPSFKLGPQGLGTAVTIAQVLPATSRTPATAVVYSTNTSAAQFGPRLTVTTTTGLPRGAAPRPLVNTGGTRLSIPVQVTQTGARLVTPQATVLTTGGARLQGSALQASPQVVGVATVATANRTASAQQPSVTIGRLSMGTSTAATVQMASTAAAAAAANMRTLNIHSLVVANAAANSQQVARGTVVQAQAPKVITSQPGAIHYTPIPASGVKGVPVGTNRALNVIAQRSTVVTTSKTLPLATSYNQQSQLVETHQGANQPPVFIHAPLTLRTLSSSPGPTTTSNSAGPNPAPPPSTSTTTPPSSGGGGGPYFYDTSVANNYPASSKMPRTTTTGGGSQFNQQRPSIVSSSNHQVRFNPVSAVDPNRATLNAATGANSSNNISNSLSVHNNDASDAAPLKVTSSPRPSILRKRDHEGAPVVVGKGVAKNLSAGFTPIVAERGQAGVGAAASPASPPSRPDSHSSGGGSTTISATSSPGALAEELNDEMVPMNKEAAMQDGGGGEDEEKVKEMSPRKKPRKQQLTGDINDHHDDDMQFITETALKRAELRQKQQEEDEADSELSDGIKPANNNTIVKPANATLLNSYRQTWKATHNHYVRYSDVRPKDDRRPTIMDLANQYRVQEKVNGWKIHHLSTQMEDLADQEQGVYDQLTDLLKNTESQGHFDFDSGGDKNVNRVNELIKGNLQRIKIINDGMIEAKTQIMRIFDHKVHVSDIINRCASKRNFKKRDKALN